MSQFTDVGHRDDFSQGSMRIVKVGQTEIGIVRWKSSIFAIRNVCPHQGGPVCGIVLEDYQSDHVGSVKVGSNPPRVACAWHHWEFDVLTGKSAFSPKMKVKTYKVVIDDGRVLVEL